MASALPILLAAGAAALLLGKKKKTSGGEPGYAPGAGMEEEDEAIDLILMGKQVTPKQEMILSAVAAKPVQPTPETKPERVAKEEADTKPAPTTCKIGTLSSDKKYVCWGSPGARDKNMRIEMRRVVPYKEARNSAIAVALGTVGGGGVILTQSPRIQFAVFCWLNRSKLYRCTSRYKTGKKRCKPGKWERY